MDLNKEYIQIIKKFKYFLGKLKKKKKTFKTMLLRKPISSLHERLQFSEVSGKNGDTTGKPETVVGEVEETNGDITGKIEILTEKRELSIKIQNKEAQELKNLKKKN